MSRLNLTKKAVKEIEERFELQREAEKLLSLIAVEFESDPMSVQCFDLRIVDRVKFVSKRLSEISLFY